MTPLNTNNRKLTEVVDFYRTLEHTSANLYVERIMANILVLHGPNLNLLGTREPEHYGGVSIDDINQSLANLAKELGNNIECQQSNDEAWLIEKIHQTANDKTDFLIFNPAAFTHTSVALRDALLAVELPFIEVHLSNTFKREAFRKHSYFSDVAVGVISGLGFQGYLFALQAANTYLSTRSIENNGRLT